MEINYKEKYEEVLNKANVAYKDEDRHLKATLERIFPELAESEDEKIRKAIIEGLREMKSSFHTISSIKIDDAIAWLEKQEGCEYIKKDWLEHIKQSWYKEGFIDGKYSGGTSKEWTINDAATLKELIDFLENGTAKLQHDLTRYANWLKNQFTPIEKQGEKKPDYCHHEVDLSNCSEEYRKAYYDGWNNCNMQYSQCKSESNDVVKCLINGMKFYYEDNEEATWGTEKFSMKVKDILAWLEKQKSADNVGPKFHEGEWVIDKQGIVHQISNVIENVTNHTYSYDIVGGGYFNDNTEGVRLWTIQDAKDGDVLACKNELILFKSYDNKNLCYYCWYNGQTNNFFPKDTHTSRPRLDIIVPATKEQRDLLFQKMKEAGYEWDAEKKELKKFHIIDEGKSEMDYCFTKMMGGEKVSSAWSEEDDSRYSSCLYMLEREPSLYNWLQSLKDRVQPQPKQEWSEEDSYYINNIIHIIEEINNAPLKRREDWEAYINWLKSLRPQNNITDEELAQAKKDAYNDALDKIEYHSGEPTFDDGWSAAIDYIQKKSLRPQNRWKPSDEQMEALLYHCSNGSVLSSLYNDLNKLKEK